MTRSDDDSGDDHPFREDLSPRVLLGKLETHSTYQRQQLEAMHGKIRIIEAAQSSHAMQLDSHGSWRKVTMAIVGAVAVAALGSLWTAYTAARDAGNRDGRVDTRIEQLEHVVDKLGTQIESLWRARVRSATGDLQ